MTLTTRFELLVAVNRVNLRHGVSTLGSGRRHAVGINFHDAA